MRVAFALGLMFAANLVASGPALAQAPELRDAGVVFDDAGRAAISLALSDFITESPERLDRMSTGLRHVLALAVTAVDDESGRPLARATRRCAIRYDAWTQEYSLEIRGDGAESYDVLTSDVAVVERCLTLTGLVVGDRTSLAGATRVHFDVAVTLNPADAVDMHEVRQWLGRPDGATDPRAAFFGFFVSQFVSRVVLGLSVGDEHGDSEARLEVRTPAVSSP